MRWRENKWLKITAIVVIIAFVPFEAVYARGRRGGGSGAVTAAAIGGAALPLTAVIGAHFAGAAAGAAASASVAGGGGAAGATTGVLVSTGSSAAAYTAAYAPAYGTALLSSSIGMAAGNVAGAGLAAGGVDPHTSALVSAGISGLASGLGGISANQSFAAMGATVAMNPTQQAGYLASSVASSLVSSEVGYQLNEAGVPLSGVIGGIAGGFAGGFTEGTISALGPSAASGTNSPIVIDGALLEGGTIPGYGKYTSSSSGPLLSAMDINFLPPIPVKPGVDPTVLPPVHIKALDAAWKDFTPTITQATIGPQNFDYTQGVLSPEFFGSQAAWANQAPVYAGGNVPESNAYFANNFTVPSVTTYTPATYAGVGGVTQRAVGDTTLGGVLSAGFKAGFNRAIGPNGSNLLHTVVSGAVSEGVNDAIRDSIGERSPALRYTGYIGSLSGRTTGGLITPAINGGYYQTQQPQIPQPSVQPPSVQPPLPPPRTSYILGQ